MLEVLKYLDPLWYFNLETGKDAPAYFSNYEKLSKEEQDLIDFDPHYTGYSLEDAAFQGLKRGLLQLAKDKKLELSHGTSAPITDHYHFCCKYFHRGWVFYFFLFRILSLKNPFKELHALYKTRKVRRVNLYHKASPVSPDNFSLQGDARVSVILPTLDRYEYLRKVLDQLSRQSVPPSEIFIVDQSSHKNPAFYDHFRHLPIQLILQKEKGQWFARNTAISRASGEYILLVDDDSEVQEDWIEKHLSCLSFFNADISAGVSIPKGKVAEKGKTFFHWAEEFDSGNAMVKRSVFEKVGLFDQGFDGYRMGDAEFGLRSYLAGFKSVSNPLSGRVHLEASYGGMRSWGSIHAFQPASFRKPQPDAGVLYLYRNYFNKKYLLSFLLARIFLSYIPRGVNNPFIKYAVAFMCFVGLFPLIIGQIIFQWNKAKKISPHIPRI